MTDTGQIFDKQEYVRITTTYKKSISADIKLVKIRYKPPGLSVWGEWDAVHDADNKKIYYDFPKDTTPETVAVALGGTVGYGIWTFRSYAIMNDDRPLPGTEAMEMIYEMDTTNIT